MTALSRFALLLIVCQVNIAVAGYLKISNSGKILPDTAVLGNGPDDWGCTYDSATELMWEIKTTEGLRKQTWQYTWYSSNSVEGQGTATNSDAECDQSIACNTQAYMQRINAQTLCAASDWRLPTLSELSGLLQCSNGKLPDNGCVLGSAAPTIDSRYFPHTSALTFWSASSGSLPYLAQTVNFYTGRVGYSYKSTNNAVRLVRDSKRANLLPSVNHNTDTAGWITAVTLSGRSSGAALLGKMTADAGKSYATAFNVFQKINVSGKIRVAPKHIGQKGLIYIVVCHNQRWYMKTPQGWIQWDTNPASLKAFNTLNSLNAEESVDIQQQLFDLPGQFAVYLGYQVDQDIHYNAKAFNFTVNAQIVSSKLLNAKLLKTTLLFNKAQAAAITMIESASDGSLLLGLNKTFKPLPLNTILTLPALEQLGLPLGYTGLVSALQYSGEQLILKLIPVPIEDVYQQLTFEFDSWRDDAHIVDIIAPPNAKVQFKRLTSKAARCTRANNGSLGCTQSGIAGTLSVAYTFKAPVANSSEQTDATLHAEVNLTEGRISAAAEFNADNVTTPWQKLQASLQAKVNTKISLKTASKNALEIPAIATLLNEQRENRWVKAPLDVNHYFVLSGLDDHKSGLLPLGGLVLAPIDSQTTTNALDDNPLGVYQGINVIVWLYLDWSGKVVLQGEADIIDAQGLVINQGINLKPKGTLLLDNNLDLPEINTLPNLMTKVQGTLQTTHPAKVTIAVDLLTGGLRPLALKTQLINAALNTKLVGSGAYQWFPIIGTSGNLCIQGDYKLTTDTQFTLGIKAALDNSWLADLPGGYRSTEQQLWQQGTVNSQCLTPTFALGLTASAKNIDNTRPGHRFVELDLQDAYRTYALHASAAHWELVDVYYDGTPQIRTFDLSLLLKNSTPAGRIMVSLVAGKQHALKLQTRAVRSVNEDNITLSSATQYLDIPALSNQDCIAPQSLQAGICAVPATEGDTYGQSCTDW